MTKDAGEATEMLVLEFGIVLPFSYFTPFFLPSRLQLETIMKQCLTVLVLSAWLALAPTTAHAVPVAVSERVAGGISVRVVQIDLKDPNTYLTILLANNAPRANSAQGSYGDEPFAAMVARAHAAAVINGTFFSKDAQKRVMGNMVRAGGFVKYSQWEDAGTTFGLRAGNIPEMITARAQGKPDWQSHWFSVTCGPRLLKDGQIWLHPAAEGFSDSHVLGAGGRSALGYSRDGHFLYLVSFMSAVTLDQEARTMKALGTYQAMNLDGGASQALATAGQVVVPAGRNLTNVIAVYDQKFPAPATLKQAQQTFLAAHPVTTGRTEITGTPADRFVERLKPGAHLDFSGLRFQHVLRDPIVGIRGGVLTFSEKSYGQIFASWPKARPTYTLEFEARLVDEFFAVMFDASKGNQQVQGLSLEYRQASPSGLYLRYNGTAINYDQHLAIDKAWHRFRVVVDSQRVAVYMDGQDRPLLTGQRAATGQGIGLAGRGEFRGFKILDLPAPGT